MLEIVKETIKEHKLINDNDKIVVAVSGGADSVALLHVLHTLKETYNLTLYVCHLNHCAVFFERCFFFLFIHEEIIT